MSWTSRLSKKAQKQFDHLSLDLQKRLGAAITAMEEHPFGGDVTPLKAKKWRGSFRKRVGRYRIIFRLHQEAKIIDIAIIELRTEKTYR